MVSPKIQDKLDRWTEMKEHKQKWIPLYQVIDLYVNMFQNDFYAGESNIGASLNDEVYDSEAPKAVKRTASALMGELWPNGAKSKVILPARGLSDSSEIKDWFHENNEIMDEAMDDPRAGLATSLVEYFEEQLVFGTSGIGVFNGKDQDLLYKSYSVESIWVDEDAAGQIDTVYEEMSFSVRQLVGLYGLEKVSKKTRELFNQGKKSEKVKILVCIEPRTARSTKSYDNKNMPYEECIFEIDEKHELKVAGYEEQPIFIGRYFKRKKEKYGRSPAMAARPEILELNAVKEGELLAIEKLLDPPLVVTDDGSFGGEVIDTSAGGIIVYRPKGRISNEKPIYPLNTVQELQAAEKKIAAAKMSVNEHFNLDRLLDFNNETQMTLGEVQLREQLRGKALGAIFARQISEVFNKLVARSFNIEFAKGKFGYVKGSRDHQFALSRGENARLIPDEIAQKIMKGQDFYRIKYLTPAARLVEAAKATGTLQVWEFAGNMAQVFPGIANKLNAEKSLEILADATGAPRDILHDEETVKAIEQAQAEQAQAQEQMQQEMASAQVNKDEAQAFRLMEGGRGQAS